jgi:hypothetical protein
VDVEVEGAMPETETWSSQDCARAWGVQPATWLGYVSRGQAPPPLPGHADGDRGRRWDPEAVRRFPRPGVGRSRAGATPQATDLLDRMREVAAGIEELRARQRELLTAGRREGLEILAMARALGISRQTAYSWLDDR